MKNQPGQLARKVYCLGLERPDERVSLKVSAATEVWDILPSRSTQSIFPVSNELKSCLAVRL